MRSHIAVASGAILALTISFQALAQNANQSGMSASSNANSGGAASNSNSSKTPVNMGIVRQGLLGVIPAVAPYQENSPGPHITSPDPASLTMATMGAFSNAIGQAMLPPDAPPWQRAVVAGISGAFSSMREGVGPSIITGLYGAATSVMGSAADFVTAPPDWESFRKSHGLPPPTQKNSPAYENAQIAINAGLAGLGTAGVTGVAAWLTDMAIVPVIEGTAIVANAPVLIPTLVIAGGIAFVGTVIDKKLDLPPFLYTDPQGVPGNTASNTNQNFGDGPPASNTDANTNTSNLAGGSKNDSGDDSNLTPPAPNLEPNPVPIGEQAALPEPPPPDDGDPANSASNSNRDSPPDNAGSNDNGSGPGSETGDNSNAPPPSLEPNDVPVGEQAGLPNPPKYGDPGEGGMGPPPPPDSPPVTGPSPSPIDVSKILEGLVGGQQGGQPQQTPSGPSVSALTPDAPQPSPPVTQPAATPAQPQQPPVTPAAGQQGAAASPQLTNVLTLCYKASYLEGNPTVCTEGGPYCNDGSSVSKWSSAPSADEQCKGKGGVWTSADEQQLCTTPPPEKNFGPEFCQPAECRPPGANERSWQCTPLQPAGTAAQPPAAMMAVAKPALLPPVELSNPAAGAPALLPPVVLAPTPETSAMPKPPSEASSMPKPPSVSSHVAKTPKARGRRTAKRYAPRRVPAQRYDPAATAAAIGAIIGAINAANASKRSRGGGGGGGHSGGH